MQMQFIQLGVEEVKQSQRRELIGFSSALEDYLRHVSPTPPSSLDVLVSTPGFEYLNSIRSEELMYETASFTDERVTYTRVLLYIQHVGAGLSDAEYLENNQCGVAPFDSDSNWCGNLNSHWYVTDNRNSMDKVVSDTLMKMDRMLQNIGHAYRLNGAFPNQTALGVTINDNESVSLALAVNYTGSQRTCAGQFDFDGAPLTCHQLFDGVGGEIIYHRHSDDFISLVTQFPFIDNTGSPLVYARNLEVI